MLAKTAQKPGKDPPPAQAPPSGQLLVRSGYGTQALPQALQARGMPAQPMQPLHCWTSQADRLISGPDAEARILALDAVFDRS